MSTNRTCRQFNRISAVLFCGLIMMAHPVYAEPPESEIEAPENWYQVEVILFTQQGNIGNEAPPEDYQMDFPTSWIELVDPNMPTLENSFPLAEGGLINFSQLAPLERRIPRLVVTDPTPSESPLHSAPSYEALDSDAIAETEAYIPEYEAQFLMLDKLDRDLNDSATALDRRQYNVVFHQAWRFGADDNSEDPWVLIKAGQQFDGRFQLEGALRFYRSRFLHFETNLWLLGFPNLDERQPQQMITLPALPVREVVAVDEMALSDDYNDLTLGPVVEEGTANLMPGVTPDEVLSNELVALDRDAVDIAASPEPIEPKTYPISSVWVLNQSKRVEEETIYYIDHPMMGVMVTIKGYEPPLLNPPSPADLDAPVSPLEGNVAADPLD